MEESKYSKLVQKYSDMVYRIAFSYMKNREDAEDIYQNVFLKLFNKRDFLDMEHEKRWLIRVTMNECHSLYRSPWKRRRQACEDLDILLEEQQVLTQSVQKQTSSDELEEVTFTFEKMCINTNSQRIYFHATGLPDSGVDIVSPHIEDDPYSFGLSGTDSNGNEVVAGITEIRDGYGYFELSSCDSTVGLDYEVKYYDLQMDYDWEDPEHIVCSDEEEGIWYGKSGKVGKPFRIDCQK